MITLRRLIAFLLMSLLISLTGCSKGDGGPPAKKADAAAGAGFSLTSVDEKTVSLADFKGKVVLLDFWATWCPPCQRSIPHLVEMQTKYEAKGFTVIGISLDQNREDLIRFLTQRPVNYPVLLGSEAVKQDYKISSIPRMFVLDREGMVVGDFLGFSEENAAAMDAAIRKAL